MSGNRLGSAIFLAHCIARAVIHDQGGVEAATEKYGPRAERLSKWAATMAAAKVTGKASRVSAFIVMWAAAMRSEGAMSSRLRNISATGTRASDGHIGCKWSSGSVAREHAERAGAQNRAASRRASLSRRDIATLPARLMVTA